MVNSLYYAFVFLGSVVFCLGLALFLSKPFYNLAISAVKQLDIILDQSIGEREKDQNILHNILTLLKHLLLTLCLLILLLICGILPALIYSNYKLSQEADTSSVYFYISMFLGSFSLLIFRKKADYSYWSKLLHELILDNYNIGRYFFKQETKITSKDNVFTENSFVIVTGLARGGTTALTNLLYDENIFHSIKYANVPFLLAPNTWKKIYNPRNSKKSERAHGDKVLFSENSIEAFDEYFFKVFLKDSYIKENHLKKHEINKELLFKYYKFQDLFKQRKNTLYLAKNNNFILRYESILEYNNNFKLVLIFRNPLDHAKSLLRQHENFLNKQKEDNFVLKYMNWLGHYEFGLNQKYFALGNEKLMDKYDKAELSYWLAIWVNYYSYINKLLNTHKIFLVNYENLLIDPIKLKNLLEINLEIKFIKKPQEQFKPQKYILKETHRIDNDLLEKANKIYSELENKRNK